MGTRKNNLTWSWPLISLEWVPEILSSFGSLIEPTWAGLRRQMTANAQNRAFANGIFSQLQKCLLETSLVIEKGRFIRSAGSRSSNSTKKHLAELFEESDSAWADFFRTIHKKKIELRFDRIDQEIAALWPDISNYSVFKQWSEYFQYLGFGTLLRHDRFFPDSAITYEMASDPIFVERCLKANGDPRHLTGVLSLHAEADFLAWTIGEEHLPISEDPNLFPRIPLDAIKGEWAQNTHEDSWRTALSVGRDKWAKSIRDTLSAYPFSNLPSWVYTCKYLLDYFLFGRPSYNTDFLDQDGLLLARKKWNSVKAFYCI